MHVKFRSVDFEIYREGPANQQHIAVIILPFRCSYLGNIHIVSNVIGDEWYELGSLPLEISPTSWRVWNIIKNVGKQVFGRENGKTSNFFESNDRRE